jgi:hypothetical protein
MSTLLFCTSFSETNEQWYARYKRWFDYYSNSNLNFNKCLIIDDGSPVLPTWKEFKIVSKSTNLDTEPLNKNSFVSLTPHLGRPSSWNFPGWFRSFAFAAKYAVKHNFKKVIHIESDSFLLSDSIIEYVNQTTTGWTAFWCNRHNFPESAIQIIGEDQLNNFYYFVTKNYNENYANKPIECVIPFTNINKQFIGDRYSEFSSSCPKEIDYCCQFLTEWKLPKITKPKQK